MTSYHWYEVNMPDQIKSMRVFLAVVATRSFSAAGRQLGMSQAMATKHISGLEQMLGVQLLRRTTRFVVATEAGERFAEASRRVIEEFDEATAVTRAGQGEPRGLLRMNVPVSFGLRVINPIIGDFAERHPSLAIDLELNDRRVDLFEGGWDLAVRVGELADSPLVARKLMDCPTRVCAAPAYLARHGTPRTVADLARHACLGYSLSDVTNASAGPSVGTRAWWWRSPVHSAPTMVTPSSPWRRPATALPTSPAFSSMTTCAAVRSSLSSSTIPPASCMPMRCLPERDGSQRRSGR
jgi:DNA-binding transcriptional LysR family regulator